MVAEPAPSPNHHLRVSRHVASTKTTTNQSRATHTSRQLPLQRDRKQACMYIAQGGTVTWPNESPPPRRQDDKHIIVQERIRHFTNNEHHPRAAKQPPSRKQQQRQQLYLKTIIGPGHCTRGDSGHELGKLRVAMALCFPPSRSATTFARSYTPKRLSSTHGPSPQQRTETKQRTICFSLLVNLPAGLHPNKNEIQETNTTENKRSVARKEVLVFPRQAYTRCNLPTFVKLF